MVDTLYSPMDEILQSYSADVFHIFVNTFVFKSAYMLTLAQTFLTFTQKSNFTLIWFWQRQKCKSKQLSTDRILRSLIHFMSLIRKCKRQANHQFSSLVSVSTQQWSAVRTTTKIWWWQPKWSFFISFCTAKQYTVYIFPDAQQVPAPDTE